jgi:hypothetical protein
MQANIKSGLGNKPIITQCAVLAIYSQLVDVPYMSVVRGGANFLDLQTFHKTALEFCQARAQDPNLALHVPDGAILPLTLDGKRWRRPDVFEAVMSIYDELPLFSETLQACFEGSVTGWKRFNSEFEEGGTIDQMRQHEKDALFINATNCVNEGLLGALRVGLRATPNMTPRQFNAKELFKRNDTSSFYRFKLSTEDRARARRIARSRVRSGSVKKKRNELAQARQRAVLRGKELHEKAQERARKKRARLASIRRIESDFLIRQLSGAKLNDQFIWYVAEVKIQKPNMKLPTRTSLKTVAQLREAVLDISGR